MSLKKELLELKGRVDDFKKVNHVSNITSNTIELSDDISLPYTFTCEALHPGIFKGFEITEDEIIKGQSTIFNSTGNFANYEINVDHKNNRKEDSSVNDLVGKVVEAKYDRTKKAYIITGEVYDKSLALRIAKKIIKYVSLRINPDEVDYSGTVPKMLGLKFEELSFVRAPGDANAKIY